MSTLESQYHVIPSCDVEPKDFKSKDAAKDARADHAQLCTQCSMDSIEIEEIDNRGDSKRQEGGRDESHDKTNGTQPTEAEVVEKKREGRTDELMEQTKAQMDTPTIQDQEAFVTEVKGVPDTFVVNMGTADNKSIHIKKEGYYYLAAQMDLQFHAEPINPTWEGDSDTSAFRGVVEDNDGRTWTNVGTAHKDGEDMQGAEYNLDELAATRAATRALSMATGTGVASMEEMIGVDNE